MNNKKEQGSPVEQVKKIVKEYGDSLAEIKDIKPLEYFRRGLFSKPQWIKDKENEVRNGGN